MQNIVVFGYGYEGTIIARRLYENPQVVFYGFADNSIYKQGKYAYGYPIRDIEGIKELDNEIGVSVIIASKSYKSIIDQCIKNNIKIEGVFLENRIHHYPFASFSSFDFSKDIRLYAGDIYDDVHYEMGDLYGLSLTRWDEKHINHDIRNPFPIPDNSIYGFEAEDVFEYVERERLVGVIDEIHRILKPGGCLRICMPDYNTDYIIRRSMTDSDGRVLFDAGGGGNYNQYGIADGGQVYFATYEDFSIILNKTKFTVIDWLCYCTRDGRRIKKRIDNERGYLNRVSNDTSEDFCLVVDCIK